MGTNMTGPKTRKGARSLLRQALPTDPIYTRGYSVGGGYSTNSLKNTQEETLEDPKNKPEDNQDK